MDCQKHLFSLPENHHYLNCAYLSPLSKSVEQAGIDGIARKRIPWSLTPSDFFTECQQLREQYARLINVSSPSDIAIIPSASYGFATVAKNLPVNGAKKIIVAGEQFPSNIYSWKRFCDEHGATLHVVDAPEGSEDRGKLWNERILDAIDSDTLLVALGHIHWTDGTLFRLEEIGQRVRETDAYLAIDGTQSVGALPFDVQKIQPDALITAGYKWLMGPYSIGMGYFGPRLQGGAPLEEGWLVRKDSEDFSALVNYADAYQPGAIRYDVGERSNFILVPMMIAALKQLLEWKPSEIQRYCRNLTSGLSCTLPDLGYRIEDPDWRAHHLFGIRLPEHVQTTTLQQKLAERNIYVSIRGSAIRVSPHIYNDKADIQALLEVLEEAV